MVRYTFLTLFILFFSGYALKDWYRGLLGLLFLVAVMERPDMPESMFGVPGLSPFNFLLAFIILGWIVQRAKEPEVGQLPKYVSVFLLLSVLMLFVSTYRMATNLGYWPETRLALGGFFNYSQTYLYVEFFLTPIKWAIPGLLVMSGCRTDQRVRETVGVMLAVVVVLALQILKSMPITMIADGYALQKRAVRVLDRDIGFHRNQISIWMASGFWLLWMVMTEIKSRGLKLLALAGAGLVFFALIMTGSRGGLLSWGLAGVIFAWVRWRKLLFIGPVIVLIAVMLVPALQERVFAGFTDEDISHYDVGDGMQGETLGLAAASSGRTIFWAYSLPKIGEKVFFGWGRNAMIRSGVTYQLFENYNASMAVSHPHNAYLQLFFDVGVLGAIVIMALYFIVAFRSYAMFKQSDLMVRIVGGMGIAWVGTYLISGVTASTFYPNEGSVFVWVVMGMVVGVGLRRPKQVTKLQVAGQGSARGSLRATGV